MTGESRIAILELSVSTRVRCSEVDDLEHEFPLSWAPGMIGVLAVFDSEAAAAKYVEGLGRDPAILKLREIPEGE